MTSRIQQQIRQVPSLLKRGSVLHHLFRMKCYQTFHRSPHNLDNMKMMLILHHISQGSFKIMSDASHEPYHRNPHSQRRIPGFHARFQLRDILLTGFYILDIRYEIVLVKSMEVAQYHPIQCHRLIQFITAVLIFLSLCYLLRNKRTDGSQKTVCQRFTIHLVDDTGIIQSRPLQKPLLIAEGRLPLKIPFRKSLPKTAPLPSSPRIYPRGGVFITIFVPS